jgi:hypothetical protein
MLDEVTTAIATGAAGNIIAHLLDGKLDSLRAQVARIFRHGTDEQQTAALQALDTDAAALARRTIAGSDLTERWADLLLSYLSAHPGAREDLEAFALAADTNEPMNIGSQNNYGAGPFIGRDNYGSMTFKSKG